MTNAEAIRQLRETASTAEALAALRAALTVLLAQGASHDELFAMCANTLAAHAESPTHIGYWQ